MDYALVISNEVLKWHLPKVGTLSTGETVSNYDKLPEATLLAEGWLPLIDNPPVVMEEYYFTRSGFLIYSDRVEVTYEISKVVPPVKSLGDMRSDAALIAEQIALKPLITSDSLTETDLLGVAPLFPEYEVNKAYVVGDIFTYNRSLFEVIQAHTSQESWIPDDTPSLYKNHTPKGTVEEWRQPLGSQDAYQTGDQVMSEGELYTSLIDNNVWAPDVYGWELYEENPPEYPEWVQPEGSHDAYQTDDIVTHNSQLWISTIANNVWEPGVYGWDIYTE